MINAILCTALVALSACEPFQPKNNPITYGEGYMAVQLNTNKAVYSPGETVQLTLNKEIEGQNGVMVRYSHLGNVLKDEPFSSLNWTWQPPSTDFQGYLIDLHKVINGRDSIFGSIAVDVSSRVTRFPRNGFLSAYGDISTSDIYDVMKNLNRYHMNYIQFQDWHWKHHWPLAGTATSPMEEWTDIINRICYKKTVENYISQCHNYGMKAIFYNLAYGALSDACDDGVKDEWYLYTDPEHGNKDAHLLGGSFKSSIFLVNPANIDWQNYLAAKNSDVYAVFGFDGYHIDQLGYRGIEYDYYGNIVNITDGFTPFINAMKAAAPDKMLTMNAVGQYGQYDIVKGDVEFLYTEVWDHNDATGFTIFSDIITENDRLSNGKETVLAAYMNYNLGNKGRGYFNTPGVIMAMAASFAWGGSMLQLGEHMLCNEYFPNNNLTMHGDLKKAVIRYYDFLTAYENPLREDGEWYGVDVTTMDPSTVTFNQWAPVKGQIATVGKRIGNTSYVHLLNYTSATHLDWCDSNGNQAEQPLLTNITVSIDVSGSVNKVWVATPDADFGVAHTLEFIQKGNKIELTIPSIKYWTMLCIEQ